jgi:hypothetical protein
MKPTIHVPITIFGRIQSSDTVDDYHYAASVDGAWSTNSLILSGLDDGSPLSTSSLHGGRSGRFGTTNGMGQSESATSSTSKVDLLGQPSLPSPLMDLANGDRILFALRRERTPPPSSQLLSSHSNHGSLSRTENEIIGELVDEMVVPEILGDMACDSELPGKQQCYGDRGVSHWFAMTETDDESFIATTTGASVRKLTPHSATTSHSARSDVSGLFSTRRSYLRGSGLFDSHEDLSSSAREMMGLNVPSPAPLHHCTVTSQRH